MKRERKGKKNIKRLLMGILVLAFLSNNTYADNIDFKDVTEQWAKEPVRWGVKEGIVEGYPDGTFKPKKQVNEAEFAKLMTGYAKVLDVSNLKVKEGEYWAKEVYDALEEYAIPLGGYKSDKVKNTGLSRGQLARIVAAKNGFNLNERQAIYYLYENDLSDGKISGRLDFESYDKDSAVKRAEAVAFLRRLETKGVTTFKGKPSTVGAREMGGIKGVPKDETVVTDEDFKKLAEEKGIKQVEKNNSSYAFANKVADKYGLKVDDGGDPGTGFELKEKSTNRTIISYTDDSTGFNIFFEDYKENKPLIIDLLKSTGRFTDSDIKEVINIIEVKHMKDKVPQYYDFGKYGCVEPAGGYGEMTLRFGFSNWE
ncbi:S-layer homology domain-containing protein [Sporanaerobacter acetigenes]|uniref:S-layer homology domain-containing protein n=1 Tax=Sporanaerobacter acetigenes TaxID=165813 RepID=UPI00331FAB96